MRKVGLLSVVLAGSCWAATEDFSSAKVGETTELRSALGAFSATSGHMAVNTITADGTPGSLHILGGEGKEVVLELAESLKNKALLELRFNGERWTSAKPFEFKIEGKQGDKWVAVYDGNKLPLRALKRQPVSIDLKGEKYDAFKFVATTKEKSGVLLDNITVTPDGPMVVGTVEADVKQIPLLIRKDDVVFGNLVINATGSKEADTLKSVSAKICSDVNLDTVESFSLYAVEGDKPLAEGKKLATAKPSRELKFDVSEKLKNGENKFALQVKIKDGAALDERVAVGFSTVELEKKGKVKVAAEPKKRQRIGFNVATAGDEVVRTDGSMKVCKRMRIPGMVTTKAGTLLAVYDLRWNQNGDLPGDIDIGLSRSTDGGKTWEAPRPVVDMGNWLGESESKNGVGDPAILVDDKTGHIYIAGLVAHGLDRGWYWGISKPGLDPKVTGQVVISKSEDDGKTWSTPVNITKDIKDPAWQLMLQGPGAGISMRDGTLVFAFQYKVNLGTATAPKYSARSSIMYSKDHGKSWKVAPGVDYPQETTEAQVVELNDGSLMLNCRISAGGRAVFTTKDLGETWTTHKTSGRGTFNMTGCMASILRYSSTKDGDEKDILLFSGPADGGKKRRSHMAVRYSLDEGETWSTPYLLDKIGGAYSCLTLIEENGKKDIGIIYEGSQSNMCFERLTLEELMGK